MQLGKYANMPVRRKSIMFRCAGGPHLRRLSKIITCGEEPLFIRRSQATTLKTQGRLPVVCKTCCSGLFFFYIGCFRLWYYDV